MRLYQPILHQLATKLVCTVRYSQSNLDTLIRGVKKEKTQMNVSRRAVGLPAFGRLSYTIDQEKRTITFRLTYSGDML